MDRRGLTSRRGAALVVLAAAGTLTLSSCDSEIHPGAAAVVDGTRIEQSQVDDTAQALCNLILAGQGSQQSSAPSFADLRSSLTDFQIQVMASDAVAKSEGLTIYPADVQKVAAQLTLPDGLSDDDVDTLTSYVDDISGLWVTSATINAHADDSGVTSSADVQVDPSAPPPVPEAVTQKLEDDNVAVNPMYGVWDGSAVTAGSGSLSAPVSAPPTPSNDQFPAEDSSSDQPPSQVCSP
jgi:hypothetical protein